MPPDPQLRAVLDTFESKGLLPLVRGDAAGTRARYRQLALSCRGPQYGTGDAPRAHVRVLGCAPGRGIPR